jgi:hypothetical protein
MRRVCVVPFRAAHAAESRRKMPGEAAIGANNGGKTLEEHLSRLITRRDKEPKDEIFD